MKKKFIALAMAVLAISNFYGCDKKVDSNKQEQNQIVNEEKQKDSNDMDELKEDNLKEDDINGEGIKEDKLGGENSSSETKKIGLETYGFIEVPDYWIDFKDVDLPADTTVIQYSDPSGSSIITMNIAKNYEQDAKVSAENSFLDMKNDGVDVEGARVKIGGYDAYQVYGCYEDEGIVLVSWHFKDENNTLHYVSAEGKENDIMNVVGYVENTYSLN